MIINDNERELEKAVDIYYNLVKARGFRPTVEDWEEYIFYSPEEDARELTVKINIDLQFPEDGKLEIVVRCEEEYRMGKRLATIPLAEFEQYCKNNYIDKYKNLKQNEEYQMMLEIWAD